MTNSQATAEQLPAKPRLAEQPEQVGGLFNRIANADTIFDALNQDAEQGMRFVEVLSNTLNIGEGTPPQKKSLATLVAVQMLAEKLTPAEFFAKYHIYDTGKMDLRSEWIHAELERVGWHVEWKATGEDGKKAIFEGSKNGKTVSAEFTIELAQKKGLVKPSSGWSKDPAQMLRARCITRFATMYVPSIGAGMTEDAEATGEIAAPAIEQQQKPAAAAKTTPPVTTETKAQPPAETKSEPPAESKTVTLDSMTSAIEFSKRAFTGFAKEPKISTIRQLVGNTREELIARESMGKTTVDNIETELAAHGFKLKESTPQAEDQGGSGSAEAESATPEARTDDAALAARGLALAEDDDGKHEDTAHGAAIAEIRQLCADENLKAVAKETMAERCDGKKSLHDLSALEAHIVLMFVLGTSAGVSADKLANAFDNVKADAVPIDRAIANCNKLREKAAAKN